jgi:pimeloyl-ACP methyl ester carboxylesterase
MKWSHVGKVYFLGLVVLIGLLSAAGISYIRLNEDRLVFRAMVDGSRLETTPLDPTAFHLISLTTSDGLRLQAVTLSAPPSGHSSYWILYCGGGQTSLHRPGVQGQLQKLRSLGYNVLAFDYRGFGENPGVPSEPGLYEDALAAYNYLVKDMGVRPSHVLIHGISLGSTVAVDLATKVPANGLVLFSAFDSLPSLVASGRLRVADTQNSAPRRPGLAFLLFGGAYTKYFMKNQFNSGAKISRVPMPVLIVHAVDDRTVPISVGRSLYEKVTGRKFMLETDGGHFNAGMNDLAKLKGALVQLWPDHFGT